MNRENLIYVAIAGAILLAAALLLADAVSTRRMAKLEAAVDAARAAQRSADARAAEKEKLAEHFRIKIEFLEENLADIRILADRQDEELKKITLNAASARADVIRIRQLRPIDITADELCRRLENIGYPCGK